MQKQVSNFKDNIGALSTWLINIKQQSLELDSLYLHGDDAKLPKADGNIFQKIWHEAKVFFYSCLLYTSSAAMDTRSCLIYWLGDIFWYLINSLYK